MRRANPENLYQAKRAGLRGRMVASWHVPEADVDGWDAEAAPLILCDIGLSKGGSASDGPTPRR